MNRFPVQVHAQRDAQLSRWWWLVKRLQLDPPARLPRWLPLVAWLFVIAYLALHTDQYPPFRLDQGDDEPGTGPTGPADSLSPLPADADSAPPTRNRYVVADNETSRTRP